MAKPVKLKRKQYENLMDVLKKEYSHKPSVYLIRERMKRTLGFTIRFQSRYERGAVFEFNEFPDDYYVIDFFDSKKETMFLMKYGYLLDA